MGIVAKQSFITSIGTYLGVALGALNTMIIFPRIFLEDQAFLGEVNTLLAAATIVSTFGHLGLPVTIMTFFPQLPGLRVRQLFSLSILVLFSVSIIIVIGTLSFYLYFPDYYLVFYGASISVSMLFFEIFASISQNYQNIVIPSLIKNVFRRLVVLLALIMAYLTDNSQFMFFNILGAGYLIQLILIVAYAWGKTPKFTLKIKGLNTSRLLLYGIMSVLASGAMLVVSRLDILMLNMLISAEAVTFFSIAYFIGSVVSVPSKSLFLSLRPIVARAWAQKDTKLIHDLYKKTAINQLMINSFLFLLIWINIDVVYLLLPENYRQGQWVVFFIALGETIAGAMGINGLILTVTENQKYNLYSALFLIVLTVIANLSLIPILGLEGAAIASMLAIALYNLIRVIIVNRVFKFTPFTNEFKRLLMLVLVYLLIIVGLRNTGISNVIIVILENLFLIITTLTLIYTKAAFIDLRIWLSRFLIWPRN